MLKNEKKNNVLDMLLLFLLFFFLFFSGNDLSPKDRTERRPDIWQDFEKLKEETATDNEC